MKACGNTQKHAYQASQSRLVPPTAHRATEEVSDGNGDGKGQAHSRELQHLLPFFSAIGSRGFVLLRDLRRLPLFIAAQ